MKSSNVERRRRWLGLAATLLLIVAGALALRHSGPAPLAAPLRVGAFAGDVGALAWVAQEQRFFERAGLRVELRGFDTGRASVEALRAGEVDVAMASEFVVADRSFAETDLRVLASVCQYWNKGLVGRRDRGIAKPADLRGKRIGVTRSSTAEHTLVVFLALHGLALDDVHIVDLPPPQLVERIAAGDIDAAITWQPHVAAIERRLGGMAANLLAHGSDAYLLALARAGDLPAQDEAFTRFLQGLALAEDWLRADPARARRWLAARFALDAGYVDSLWPNMRLEVGLPQEILDIMDGEARWLAKNKRMTPPDFSNTLYAAPLAAARPAALPAHAH